MFDRDRAISFLIAARGGTASRVSRSANRYFASFLALVVSFGLVSSCRCVRNPGKHIGDAAPFSLGDANPCASTGNRPAASPERVVTTRQVCAGDSHTCAVTETGRLSCWGENYNCLLGGKGVLTLQFSVPYHGYGCDCSSYMGSPGYVANLPVGGPVIAVSVGNRMTCAILEGGRLRCWGFKPGSFNHPPSAAVKQRKMTEVHGHIWDVDADVGGKVEQLAVGPEHGCVIIEGGAVRCWGNGNYGKIGYSIKQVEGKNITPIPLCDVSIGGKAIQVAVGVDHTCVLLDDGAVRCWGRADKGQLGYGNKRAIGDDEVPSSLEPVPIGGKAIRIDTGAEHTCAILEDRSVRCWGDNEWGQLGQGHSSNIGDHEPAETGSLVDMGDEVLDISAGGWHTCALLPKGRVRCWGRGAAGNLGYGNTDNIGDDKHPSLAGDVDVGGKVVQISAGGAHTCALLDTGKVRCWGTNYVGQIGYPNETTGDLEPNPKDRHVGDTITPAHAGDVPYF